jgi:hypothetical protein
MKRFLGFSQMYRAGLLLCCATVVPVKGVANGTIGVADASLGAFFYSDASCLLTIDSFVQTGKTVIDADVDKNGSRMLIHCDTEDGRRLTLLARGDSLNVAQRTPLLGREQITAGDFGMLAGLTLSGVTYTDDTAPRRYVIGGSVKLRKSPPIDVKGAAVNAGKLPFASITGVLEPIIKSDAPNPVTTQESKTAKATESAQHSADARATHNTSPN